MNRVKYKAKCCCMLMLMHYSLAAQDLVIGNGCHFIINGNVKMVMRNMGIINNGRLVPGSSRVVFNGNQDVHLGGNNITTFNDVVLGKTDGKALQLQQTVHIDGTLSFASGFILLNNNSINLGLTGRLENERNGSRITGTNGNVQAIRNFTSPTVAENPGNMGIEFSCPVATGLTAFIRHHLPQGLPGGGESVRRTFIISSPLFPVPPNITLAFSYLDPELNGNDESTLSLWQSSFSNPIKSVNTIVNTASNRLVATVTIKDQLTFFNAGSLPQPITQARTQRANVNGVRLYPNPSGDQFTLEIDSREEKDMVLSLYDQSGKLLQQKRVRFYIGNNSIQWSMPVQAAGIYYISSENGELKNVKVIRQ